MIEFKKVVFNRKNLRFNFDVKMQTHQFISLVGPSGSGKSTFLELIAGFLTPDQGSVHINGRDVTHLPVEQRHVSYAFQQNALFPHLDIQSNVALALHDQKGTFTDKVQKAQAILNQMGLEKSLWLKKPSQLSGGELTRANLARAILRPAEVLLLDEPFASVDEATRLKLLDMTYRLHVEKKVTTVFVTHQRDDAHRHSEQIIELSKGQIVNISHPH